MKIIFVDPQSYNNLGDYDKYLLENIPVSKIFICSHNMPYESINNTRIIKNYKYHLKRKVFKVFSYLYSQICLIKIIKKEKPDIIHFQWFKIPLYDFIVLKTIKLVLRNVTIIFTAHNVLPHDTGIKFKKHYKRIYSFVDSIIVHTEITRDDIHNEFCIPENKINIIPHGFLPTKFKFNNMKKPVEENILTFSFIGFLSDYKGLDILLDAWCNNFKIINSKECRLIIAGAGDLPCLKTIPNNKNIVLENYFHTEEELARIISSTDIAVLPYREISQSGVLLTYLAEHIPVIVSNIGGLIQPFDIGKVGWILKELSASELSETIENVINNKTQIKSITNDYLLWKKIDDYYNWKSIGKKTYSLYLEMQALKK